MDFDSKKIRILKAAEKILAERSQDCTLSEIAREAGVTDSIIYHYFNNKEDLIFSVAEAELKNSFEILQEQIQGLRDPVNKLSKMIWFQLYYHDKHPDYANLLLFECRSNRNFHQHEGFRIVRKWAGLMRGILEEGMREKLFRPDLNVPVVRDAIFGLLDLENIHCLTTREAENPHNDLDDIMNLVLPMIAAENTDPPKALKKSEKISSAAERLFAEKGYEKTTISEISGSAGVAEGTVYEYFKNKEDLLFSISQKRFQEHMDRLTEIFVVVNPLRKLRRFIRNHFFLYLTQKDFLKIFLFHAQLNRRFYGSAAYPTFQSYVESIYPILAEGKKDGSIRPDMNNRVFKNLFLGAFNNMALRWFFLDSEGKVDKIKEIDEIVDLLSRAVIREKG